MKCRICSRETPDQHIERHHLVPKVKGGSKGDCLTVCSNCGKQLHQLFPNKKLAKELNTLEKILSNDKMQKWIHWISKKPNDFSVCMRRKK